MIYDPQTDEVLIEPFSEESEIADAIHWIEGSEEITSMDDVPALLKEDVSQYVQAKIEKLLASCERDDIEAALHLTDFISGERDHNTLSWLAQSQLEHMTTDFTTDGTYDRLVGAIHAVEHDVREAGMAASQNYEMER